MKTLKAIEKQLPPDFEKLTPELKLHHLLLSANEVLKPSGDWILLNANMTIRELLSPDSEPEAQPESVVQT